MENRCILAVLFFYSCLVFWNFSAQGLIEVDEGYFLSVAHTFSDIARTAVFSTSKLFSSDYYTGLMQNYGTIYTVAKPSFILSAAVVDFFWRSIYSTRLVSVFAGGALLVIFCKILEIYGIEKRSRTALSMLLLASPLFLVFSRNGLSAMLAAFFLAFSFFWILKFDQETSVIKIGRLVFSGIFASLAIMAHYGSLFVAGALFLGAVLLLYKKRAGYKNYLKYFFSVAVFPLGWEAATLLALWVAKIKGITALKSGLLYSYFGEIVEQMTRSNAAQGLNFDAPLSYLKFFAQSDGLVVFILFIVGLYFFFKGRHQFKFYFVIFLILAPLTMISLSTLKVSRVFVPLLPFIYLVVAFSLSKLSRKYVLAIFALIVLLSAGSHKNILSVSSRFGEVADFIKREYRPEEVSVYIPAASILRVHFDKMGYKIEGMDGFEKMVASGIIDPRKTTLVVIDYFNSNYYNYIKDLDHELSKSYPVNVFSVPQILGDMDTGNAFNVSKTQTGEIKIFQLY